MSALANFRKKRISDPAFKLFKEVLPPLSATEREAMEAGSVWWEGELFSGTPQWDKLHQYPKPQLTPEEQQFIDDKVRPLISMLDDYKIVHTDNNLSPEVWDYLRRERFFSLNITKEFGGLEFSALANSTIVSMISTRSISAAVTVMVPNSLGPGELLSHYGTNEQKEYWLPRLADGTEIPCFALTGPEAGSDAGSIPDRGEICYGDYQGEQVLGIKLTWNKRYITLAPVSTVLGLAFKLSDPEQLLGKEIDLGITCALIPTDHPGVEVGDRHNPIGLAFMNGPTRGDDVFIPIDWIIGGPSYAGRGWRMLVECLSSGRGISLPALGTSIGHLTARTTGAYAYIRKQFGLSIGRFEGVAQPLGRIGGLTYLLESARTLTTTALDMGEKPGIVTAIAKYHMTELGRTILNDAMDIHGGRAIQLGPMNYLGHQYYGIPVAITVEGANILTRNLMIFGQGATRCHPYVLSEMEAAATPNIDEAKEQFDKLLFQHIKYTTGNILKGLLNSLTRSFFNTTPYSGETAIYYKHLNRMSRALAVASDFSMLSLGGELKRKELVSARLGDVLSFLYLASATLKRFEDQGRPQADLPFVHYALQHCLHQSGVAFDELFNNFPKRGVGRLIRTLTFPIGIHYSAPKDSIALEIANSLMTPGTHRDQLTHLCHYDIDNQKDPVAIIERAFIAMHKTKNHEKLIYQAIKAGRISAKSPLSEKLNQALALNILSQEEVNEINHAEKMRSYAIQVDNFNHELTETK
ncbi:acyl-CoA dehydrogenase [Vibrio sp. SS-MA-C1-2]|uniref:acyl-CoA dehydrogenase n=1 Tax=Vibrio sp. SS-MA-C1-2 TaxID=2908646 RepID=UPI001F381801|nr:acyl-CoA dehydrogenase [Vibrio sp. SS-MA-C1-2]UJF17635.1 acyl-CoA dehydrogenase [Vibrio sp. SS-MA-C1-2]